VIDGQIVANRMMCGEDRELFFLVGRRFGLDSRDSEAAPLLVESVLSGLCLVMALEVAERVMWPLWGEGEEQMNRLKRGGLN